MSIRETYEAFKKASLDIPMEQYNIFRKALLTSGNLKTFRDESPIDYKYKMDNPTNFDTVAMKEGRAVHTLVLEGQETFAQEYVIADDAPINPGTENPYGPTSNKYLDWAAEKQTGGKALLSIPENNNVVRIRDAVYANPKMADIFSDGLAERTLRANYCGVDCQVRPDWVSPVYGIIDLKKTANLKWFLKDAKWTYRYIHAAAFYRSVVRVALGIDYEDFPFCLAAVESQAPYKTAIYQIDPELLDLCERENQSAVEDLAECYESGIWKSGFEGIELIETM